MSLFLNKVSEIVRLMVKTSFIINWKNVKVFKEVGSNRSLDYLAI
ncbi:hypothetical protein MPNE_0327 [Mycoplasmoides pneumoniae FH]|uniref:Uncharacterized protein n=1 Tax=Mycoplasmoides pneumoniae (strain ATCC 15531 / DSM 23978 / CIP 103766 / NBRC 14401 / NCTC 10119 / FH) TaxID=722438 RepID=A0A0H3DKW1_MYCPB|nr:hypothetical protein MPNE_0327 [Mycoplasmoides pneumoniae FH]